ncbi:MAG: divalent-cation tolerance protein CutA [Acidimicrobiales bacterium]
MGCVQVQTAAGSEEEARRLGDVVLRRHLVACVQVIGPVHSRYWWEGRLESATEWLCLAKTTDDRADEVVASIRAAHSYDTPEVIVVAVTGGDDAYLRWIAQTVDRVGGDGRVTTS